MPEASPSKIGRYEIQRELGRGMMGIVYEALDPALDRRIALKTIQLAFTVSEGDRANFEQRFLAEARVAARLAHPGIVVVHDVGQDPATGALYIALEFLKGRTLAEVVAEGKPIDWREALELTRRVARALHHAHAEGVIHRDIKPANIMILPSGEPKIMDFGIAKVETSRLTATGQFFGTPLYMSPEQSLGRPVDGRSDLFSLGSVAYALLTGRQAFEGAAVTLILMRVVQDEPPPPSRLVPGLPLDLDYLVARVLAKDPADRYPDGRSMAEDIEDVLAGLPPRHRQAWVPPPPAESTLVSSPLAGGGGAEQGRRSAAALPPPSSTGATPQPESAPLPSTRRAVPAARSKYRPRPPRRGRRWAIAATVVTALAAAAIVVFVRGRPRPEPVAVTPTPVGTEAPPLTEPTPAVAMAPPTAAQTPSEPVAPPVTTPTPAAAVAPPPTSAEVAAEAPAPPEVSPVRLPRAAEPPPPTATPDPAVRTAAPAEPAASRAQVELDLEHSLKYGRLRIWVDESLVLEEDLDSRVAKKIVSLKLRKGHLEHTLEVPAGRHEIRVEAAWDDNVKTGRIWANFLPGSTRRLSARIGTGIGGLFKKDLDLEWR